EREAGRPDPLLALGEERGGVLGSAAARGDGDGLHSHRLQRLAPPPGDDDCEAGPCQRDRGSAADAAAAAGDEGDPAHASSSSTWTWTISLKLCSARKPSFRARLASNPPGQLATIPAIVASGSRRISRTASSPPT